MKGSLLWREIHHDGISWYIMVHDISWAGLSLAELRLKLVGQALSKTSAHTHKSPAHNPHIIIHKIRNNHSSGTVIIGSAGHFCRTPSGPAVFTKVGHTKLQRTVFSEQLLLFRPVYTFRRLRGWDSGDQGRHQKYFLLTWRALSRLTKKKPRSELR